MKMSTKTIYYKQHSIRTGSFVLGRRCLREGGLTVVAGNKSAWSQTGCAEYREITGE